MRVWKKYHLHEKIHSLFALDEETTIRFGSYFSVIKTYYIPLNINLFVLQYFLLLFIQMKIGSNFCGERVIGKNLPIRSKLEYIY